MTEPQSHTITPYYHKVAQRLMAEAPWVVMTLLFLMISLVITLINIEGFFSTPMLGRIVVPRMLVLMLLAPPMILIMASGSLDLSIGGTIALSGAMAAAVMPVAGLVPGLLLGMAIGFGIGLFNALLIGLARLNGFAVTFITGIALTGLYQAMVGPTGRVLRPEPAVEALPRSPIIFLLALLVTAACAALAIFTPFGRRPGPDDPPETVLRHSLFVGLPYLFSGTIAGLCGVLLVSVILMSNPQMGNNVMIEVILIALLGGTALGAGTGFVVSSFFAAIGVAFMDVWLRQILINGLVDYGLDLMLIGSWMLVALGVNTLYHKGAQRFFERRNQAETEAVDDDPPDRESGAESAESDPEQT